MAGRSRFGSISEPDFDVLLQALSSTSKGRSFLEEYQRRALPADTLRLRNSLAQIEATLASVRDQLQPERIAEELMHVSMTLDIAIEGAVADPEGDDIARRFALCDRARLELAALANSLRGEAEPGPAADQPDLARTGSGEAR